MAQRNNNVLGQSGTNFFFAVVEDNLDPMKAARVRIRCHGIHAKDKATLPNTMLPWASVMFPTTSNDMAISDMKIGTTVFGIFVDGDEMQVPFIMGVVPGISVSDNATTVSKQATERTSPQKTLKAKNRVTGIVGIGGAFSEPVDPSKPVYPQNHAVLTDGGHVFELDDTVGNERVHIFHKKGSYVEIHPDGTIVMKSVKDKYSITAGNEYIGVTGNVNMVVNGNVGMQVNGNFDMNSIGSCNISSIGPMTLSAPSIDVTAAATCSVSAGASLDLSSSTVDVNAAMTASINAGILASVSALIVDIN